MNIKIEKALVEAKFLDKCYKKFKHYCKRIFVDSFNGKNFKSLIKAIDELLSIQAIKSLAMKTPINPRKILFITSRGSYNCNARAIADEIIRQELPWDLVWVVRKENKKQLEQYPKELKIVQRNSYEFYEAASSAKVWFDNSVNLAYLNAYKKPEQIFFETWHGSLGIKRFETTTDKKWIKKAKQSGKQTDYCISNSAFETELFETTFWKNAEILHYGHARNDILLSEDIERREMLIRKVRNAIGVEDDVKILLYAPTFRDSSSFAPYNIDYEKLKLALEARFGGTWCVVVRFHFTMRKLAKKKKIKFPEFVYDVSNYEDIQDIMLAADAGITDYSSWICDFLLTKRPGFFFATDLADYYEERGFYFPLEAAPFPLARGNSELIENILNFDEVVYEQRCQAFLEEKGCIEDGHAAERIVEKLKEIIGEQ